MKQKLVFLLVSGFIAGLFYSCCKGGTGGKATIVCHVVNANTGAAVNNAIVYVYYGSSTPPPSISKFDANKNTPVNGNSVTFSGLKCGSYYLYATAYDSAVSLPLHGGGPYSLLHSNRNKTGNATISVSY
jgi:hypothetical protein